MKVTVAYNSMTYEMCGMMRVIPLYSVALC